MKAYGGRKQNSKTNASSASPGMQTSLLNVCLMNLTTGLSTLQK